MNEHQENPQPTAAESSPAADAGPPAPLAFDPSLKAYYVIIGRGAAAVVNHTTLRQTEWGRRRLGGLPVLHIGFEDPWGHYRGHRMGQSYHLLTMPGYERRPSARLRALNRPAKSSRFAADTRHEFQRLTGEYPGEIEVMPGFVALIQPEDDAAAMIAASHPLRDALERRGVDTSPFDDARFALHAPYRLLVVDTHRKSWLVYAHKIDICTGSGRPRGLRELSDYVDVKLGGGGINHNGLSPGEWDGAEPWEPPEVWPAALKGRRVISGTEALYREVDWGRGRRLCVMGEGGVGVNMVERGEKARAWLDWVAKDRLADTCFDNPRNHTVLRKPSASGTRMQPGEFKGAGNPTAACTPALKKWRFGRDSVVGEVDGTGTLKITYKTFNDGNPRYARDSVVRDYFEVDTRLRRGCFPFSAQVTGDPDACPLTATEYYDRLIVCSGQNSFEIGQPYRITALFNKLFAALTIKHEVVGFQLLTDDHHVVALCLPLSDEERDALPEDDDDETCHVPVRVLGVASFVVNNWLRRGEQAAEQEYKRTLPRQAQVEGFTFCGVAIAHANHYFDAEPNRNVNTATTEEVQALVGGDAALAAEIEDLRADSLSGFVTVEELRRELIGRGVRRWHAVGNLEDDYRPPDPFLHQASEAL